ncbi:MAG: toll/interleukin-1 receptor domain-containing protein, partial [Lachnospiraceae bacterium]|nr:toll/interleukin-1 receptor domain-containing protein [Lachnospiraceae bacterium]
MGLENVKYDAFISYRHCELDSFVSENLHKKLENFKLPKSVLKKMGLKKKKIERVFRDEAELPLSDNLSEPIMAALNNAEFLIVICTPRLPLSQWCKKEIETFVTTHDRKHVLLVLAEGEPDESFPEILLYEDVVEKDLNGNDVTIRRTREPLAAD